MSDCRSNLTPQFSQKDNCFKIRDINLAEFGRKEIELAQAEMPGLMSLVSEYSDSKPLRNVRITGSLHMTIQTAVLIETLYKLGASLRWASCNIFSTQDHAAAAIAKAQTADVFAWKGETIEEYWWCIDQTLRFQDGLGPDLIVDDGGDVTLMIHEGVRLEEEFMSTKKIPLVPENADKDVRTMMKIILDGLEECPTRWRDIAKRCAGVSEETTTGVKRLRMFAEGGGLLFPAYDVNNSVTKCKFDNIYGCKHSLPDGIMRATDVMLAGKSVLICGYGDVGKGCAAAMKACGSRVTVAEIDPICALQACMEGFSVKRLDDVVHSVDIVVTATGNRDIVLKRHMAAMKNNAIVCNIGHFDNEIDLEGLLNDASVRRENIKPQVDRFVFADGHGVILLAEGRLVNLGCATGHPSFVMSNSFSNQVLAQIDLWEKRGALEKKVYLLPRILDEKVARLHLKALDADLTEMTGEQSKYIHTAVEGPYKRDDYRY